MSEMIERLARRIGTFLRADEDAYHTEPAQTRALDDDWTPIPGSLSMRFDGEIDLMAFARVILQELRDNPTEAMIVAGARGASGPLPHGRIDGCIPYDQCDSAWRTEWEAEALATFQAALDEALKP